MRIRKLDRALQDFLAGLTWAPGVPRPMADAAIDAAGVVQLRFVANELAPADAPADFAMPGDNHFGMIKALCECAEAWTARHGGEVGTYPTGIRGQIVNSLDMRTAATWLYSIQLVAVLADPPVDR